VPLGIFSALTGGFPYLKNKNENFTRRLLFSLGLVYILLRLDRQIFSFPVLTQPRAVGVSRGTREKQTVPTLIAPSFLPPPFFSAHHKNITDFVCCVKSAARASCGTGRPNVNIHTRRRRSIGTSSDSLVTSEARDRKKKKKGRCVMTKHIPHLRPAAQCCRAFPYLVFSLFRFYLFLKK